MCRLSRNSGASNSWNPKGLSRPVVGKLFYFSFFNLSILIVRVTCVSLTSFIPTQKNATSFHRLVQNLPTLNSTMCRSPVPNFNKIIYICIYICVCKQLFFVSFLTFWFSAKFFTYFRHECNKWYITCYWPTNSGISVVLGVWILPLKSRQTLFTWHFTYVCVIII